MPHSLPVKRHYQALYRCTSQTISLRLLLLSIFLLLCTVPASASGNRQKLPQPGFRSIGLWDPQSSFRMDIAAWYPSPRSPQTVNLDGWLIRVSKDAPPSSGKYPVILISHDSAEMRLSSHDLAGTLARNGFVVIAPTHPGDNNRDTSNLLSTENFAARPRHLLKAFTNAIAHPVIGPLMDHTRIGLLGVGAGTATALQLAGISPDLSRLAAHCPQDDIAYMPLCSNWAKSFHSSMERAFVEAKTLHGENYFIPAFPTKDKELPLPSEKEPVAEEEQPAPHNPQETAPPVTLADTTAPAPPLAHTDASVLAVGLLSPGLIALFPDESLQNLTMPVGILASENDVFYPPRHNVDKLLELLPQRPALRIVQKANHADLRPPCPPVHQETFPALCGDPSPLAADSRKIRNDFFVRFFQKHLGSPSFSLPPGK